MNQHMPSTEEIKEDLDKKYFSNPEEYLKRVETLKGVGYKILRNSKGQHKVIYNNNYFNEIFDGAFGGIFNG